MLVLEVVSEGEDRGRVFRLESGRPRSIGRVAQRIRLMDTRVSRRHARVRFTEEQWHLQDLGSTHGTYLNGRAIEAPVPIGVGDEIAVGRVRLRVTEADPPVPKLAGLAAAPASAASAGARGAGAPTAPDAEDTGERAVDETQPEPADGEFSQAGRAGTAAFSAQSESASIPSQDDASAPPAPAQPSPSVDSDEPDTPPPTDAVLDPAPASPLDAPVPLEPAARHPEEPPTSTPAPASSEAESNGKLGRHDSASEMDAAEVDVPAPSADSDAPSKSREMQVTDRLVTTVATTTATEQARFEKTPPPVSSESIDESAEARPAERRLVAHVDERVPANGQHAEVSASPAETDAVLAHLETLFPRQRRHAHDTARPDPLPGPQRRLRQLCLLLATLGGVVLFGGVVIAGVMLLMS